MVIAIHQHRLLDLPPRVHQQTPVGLGSIRLPEVDGSPPPVFCHSSLDVGNKVREGVQLDESPFSWYEGVQGLCAGAVVIDQSQLCQPFLWGSKYRLGHHPWQQVWAEGLRVLGKLNLLVLLPQ